MFRSRIDGQPQINFRHPDLHPDERLALFGNVIRVASAHEREVFVADLLELAVRGDSRPRLLRHMLRLRPDDSVHTLTHKAALEFARSWSFVPRNVRPAILAIDVPWGRILEQAMSAALPLQRRCIVSLAEELDSPVALPALLSALRDVDVGVAAASDRAILRITLAATGLDLNHDRAVEWSPPVYERSGQSPSGAGMSKWESVEVTALSAAIAGVLCDHSIGRMRGVSQAAVACLGPGRRADPSDPLVRMLADAGGDTPEQAASEVAQAMRGALRWGRGAWLAVRALQLLVIDVLRGACQERLARPREEAEHETALSHAHLVLHPARRRALREMLRAGAVKGAANASLGARFPFVGASVSATCGARARWGAARLAGEVGASATIRHGLASALLGDADARVRLAAAQMASSRACVGFWFDAEPAVARTAITRASSAGVFGPGGRASPFVRAERVKQLGKLARSPHADVRRLASSELQLVDWLWSARAGERASVLRSSGGIVIRSWLERDPHRAMATLREALAAEDSCVRFRAVAVVRRAGVAEPLQAELARLVEACRGASIEAASDRRLPSLQAISANAVAAIGEITPQRRGAQSDQAVRGALSASDARVRANAVESLPRLEARASEADVGEVVGAIVELKGDAHHRVRANAIRRLIEVGGTSGALAGADFTDLAANEWHRMLGDARPGHRLAALWLAERILPARNPATLGVSGPAIVSRVRDLAHVELDPRIRVRALRALRRYGAEQDAEGAAA